MSRQRPKAGTGRRPKIGAIIGWFALCVVGGLLVVNPDIMRPEPGAEPSSRGGRRIAGLYQLADASIGVRPLGAILALAGVGGLVWSCRGLIFLDEAPKSE